MNLQPEVIFVERFVPDAEELLRSILTQTIWDERLHARLTASFGAPYNYSNMTYPEVPMPKYLQEVCEAINLIAPCNNLRVTQLDYSQPLRSSGACALFQSSVLPIGRGRKPRLDQSFQLRSS